MLMVDHALVGSTAVHCTVVESATTDPPPPTPPTQVKPASAMSGWHRHVRSIDSILYSAVAMYVLGGVSLMCAYLVHRYWVEREVGFEVRGEWVEMVGLRIPAPIPT